MPRRKSKPEPEAWQTPVDIPEIGALAGDWIVPSPRHPKRVHIVRELPEGLLERLSDHLVRLRQLGTAHVAPWGRPTAVTEPSVTSALDAFLEDVARRPYARTGHHESHANLYLDWGTGIRSRLGRQVRAVRRKLGPRICRRCQKLVTGRKAAGAGLCASCKELA